MTQIYAAKSGTTVSDQWLIGYSPSLTAGVWNGYDQGKTLSTSSDMSAHKQVWIDFMEKVHRDKKDESFEVPDGIEGVMIDIETGKLATPSCPKQRLVYLKEEDVPTIKCTDFDLFNEDGWGDFFELFPFEALKGLFD